MGFLLSVSSAEKKDGIDTPRFIGDVSYQTKNLSFTPSNGFLMGTNPSSFWRSSNFFATSLILWVRTSEAVAVRVPAYFLVG